MSSFASRLALSVLLAAGSVLTLSASSMWDWSYSGAGITASGTFVTTDTADSSSGYVITAVTGTRNGQEITALQPTGTPIPGNEPYAVDNLVFKTAGPQLTSHGFGFATSDGNYSNPFYADFIPDPGYLEFYSMPASHSSTELPVVFSATLVSTPEPGTCALVLIALASCVQRKIRTCQTRVRASASATQPRRNRSVVTFERYGLMSRIGVPSSMSTPRT